MTVSDIVTSLTTGSFSGPDLALIRKAFDFACERQVAVARMVRFAGDVVSVTHRKLGGTVKVQIKKVKRKRASCLIQTGPLAGRSFNIPLDMLG